MNNQFDEFATEYRLLTFGDFGDEDELLWHLYLLKETDYVVVRAMELGHSLPENFSEARERIRVRIRELREE